MTERDEVPGLMGPILLKHEVVVLTCLLANREESWSMSMMIIKSSSTHFLISRPLTYKMKKEVVDSIRNYSIKKYFDFIRGEIILPILWEKQLSPYLSQLSYCSQDIIDHTWVWIRVWIFQFQN